MKQTKLSLLHNCAPALRLNVQFNRIDLIELQGITWGNHIEGKALRIPYNKFASGFQSGRAYYLGFGNVIHFISTIIIIIIFIFIYIYIILFHFILYLYLSYYY